MKRLAALMLVGLYSPIQAGLWINEFHYDNTGGDMGEFVEVLVAPDMASQDLSQVTLSLYNGNGGVVYGSVTLDSFDEGTAVNGFTPYSLEFSGIQNGPDGLALDINGTLIAGQFLSYEGSFAGVGGPADGVTSTDIGVSESSGTSIGTSLQLTGSGSQYSDFTWSGPSGQSVGLLNSGQTAIPEPSAFWFLGLVLVIGLCWKRFQVK